MIILGIDPGAKGGLACVSKRGIEWAVAMPMTEDGALDVDALKPFGIGDAGYCILERVRSMPKQGVASTFQFGRVFGSLEALMRVLYGDRLKLVTPAKWKRDLQVPADKEMMLNMANAHFPDGAQKWWPAGPRGGATTFEGVAEAALLTLWLAKELKL